MQRYILLLIVTMVICVRIFVYKKSVIQHKINKDGLIQGGKNGSIDEKSNYNNTLDISKIVLETIFDEKTNTRKVLYLSSFKNKEMGDNEHKKNKKWKNNSSVKEIKKNISEVEIKQEKDSGKYFIKEMKMEDVMSKFAIRKDINYKHQTLKIVTFEKVGIKSVKINKTILTNKILTKVEFRYIDKMYFEWLLLKCGMKKMCEKTNDSELEQENKKIYYIKGKK